jgi:hypothetical protein
MCHILYFKYTATLRAYSVSRTKYDIVTKAFWRDTNSKNKSNIITNSLSLTTWRHKRRQKNFSCNVTSPRGNNMGSIFVRVK